ncbi:MAG: DegT/DnrJ/EryC1/StrS family aminotransferase [Nanoarchaeota archaeon]
MKIPFNDLSRIHDPIRTELDSAWRRIVDANAYILGIEVEKFEENFAQNHGQIGKQNVAGLSSGTDALELILRAKDIGAGDEVITVSNTFFATASSIFAAGAKPVFVDVDHETDLMDVKQVPAKITPRTKAIMPVHLYGQQADMPALRKIADEYKLVLIEDACQAHGARQNGSLPGYLGDAAAFSFFPGKNLGAFGDAGAVLSKDESLIARIKSLRNYGQTEKYHHDVLGSNKRMDGLQAAVLNVKLPHLVDWNESRATAAFYLSERLKEVPGLVLPKTVEGNTHVKHLYVIQVPDRDRLADYLKSNGIDTGIHYPVPIHMQPAFSYLRLKEGELPVTEGLSKRILSLPIFPSMREEELAFLSDRIKSFQK